MNRVVAIGLFVTSGSALSAHSINVRGLVSDVAGKPVANAVAVFAKIGLRDTTGSDGTFSFTDSAVSIGPQPASRMENMRLANGIL